MIAHGFLFQTEQVSTLQTVDRSFAVVEFDKTGVILHANATFCNALGYKLAEIKGRHHRIFVDAQYGKSAEYAAFWHRLGSGEYDVQEGRRLDKQGRTVWVQASYNPVFDSAGRLRKVVKFANHIGSIASSETVPREYAQSTTFGLEFPLQGATA